MNDFAEIRRCLADLKYEAASFRSEIKFRKLMRALKGGFNPSQPRDDRGRWSDSGVESESDANADSAPTLQAYTYAAAGKQSASYCWNQMQIDMLLCSALQPASRRAICRAQANQRYGACLAGTQIPSLSY